MSPHVDPITIYALYSFGIMVVISHARLHVTTVFLSTDTCSAKLESYPDNSGPSYGSAPSSQNPVLTLLPVTYMVLHYSLSTVVEI